MLIQLFTFKELSKDSLCLVMEQRGEQGVHFYLGTGSTVGKLGVKKVRRLYFCNNGMFGFKRYFVFIVFIISNVNGTMINVVV